MKKRWNENGDTMNRELYIEVMDGLVDMIVQRIGEEEVTAIPAVVIVASPTPDDRPSLSMWVVPDLSYENKHATMKAMGWAIAANDVVISAVFMVSEAWAITVDKGGVMPEGRISENENRKEIITLVSQDIDGQLLMVSIDIARHPDNNSIQVTGIEKNYPEPRQEGTGIHSSLLDALIGGYAEALHLLRFGVPLDLSDPYKFVREN